MYIEIYIVDVIIMLHQITTYRNNNSRIERDFALWYISSIYILVLFSNACHIQTRNT